MAKKNKKAAPTLPETLYVIREEDGEDHYFVPYENAGEISEQSDGEVVGIYHFDGVQRTFSVQKFVSPELD